MRMTVELPYKEQAKFRAWVREQKAETKEEVKSVVVDVATTMHRKIHQSANKFTQGYQTGFLRGQIHLAYSTDHLSATVHTGQTIYAPYVEFGTGKYVQTLPGYETYAWRFKGLGLRKHNMRPQPYFFKHYEDAKKDFVQRLNKMGYR